MRKIYRIYILGETPSDLKERISTLHAAAILNEENKDIFPRIQSLDLQNGKAPRSKITESTNNG